MSMTISPLRRGVAGVAILGATALGGLAVAPNALAAEPSPTASSAAALAPSPHAATQTWIVSPLPDAPIPVAVGQTTMTLPPRAAQVLQTKLANDYAQQGYQISFDQDGRLVIGPKLCDPTKPADEQLGCVAADGARF